MSERFEVLMEDGQLVCPHCNTAGSIVWLQDVTETRSVSLAKDTETDETFLNVTYDGGWNYDDGDNERLHCENCCTELDFPTGVTVDYDQ